MTKMHDFDPYNELMSLQVRADLNDSNTAEMIRAHNNMAKEFEEAKQMLVLLKECIVGLRRDHNKLEKLYAELKRKQNQ
jgi:hypothetical protein